MDRSLRPISQRSIGSVGSRPRSHHDLDDIFAVLEGDAHKPRNKVDTPEPEPEPEPESDEGDYRGPRLPTDDESLRARTLWLQPYRDFGNCTWRKTFTQCADLCAKLGVKEQAFKEAHRLERLRQAELEEYRERRIAATKLQTLARGRVARRVVERKRAYAEDRARRTPSSSLAKKSAVVRGAR
jgi:hypothetical protein